MSEKIKFSIVIPTYNRKELLTKTINSCIEQSYPDLEVIIVDDGGTDGTDSMIAEKYASNPKVKYYWKENAERGAARNFGTNRASGDYVIFLDSDDLMRKGCLALYVEKISKYGPDVLFSNYETWCNNTFRPSSVENWSEGWLRWTKFLKGNYFASMICFKKGIDKIQVPESLTVVTSEDWIFNILKTYKKGFYYINEVCFTMVDHEDRSMNSDQKFIIETKLSALNLIENEIDLSPDELTTLRSYAYYFVAIHSYVGNFKRMAFKFLLKAKRVPFMRRLFLAIKAFLGRKNILFFKRILNS
ncbi:MAG: glycosyltransferase family 2 protein [Flavobacteriales bacterium]|nr:glycosyltransferase family 2 protein [Flavobacteriales bacterium]